MSLIDWLHESEREISEFGITGVRGAVSKFAVGGAKRLGRSLNYGTSPFGKDWDVLILLDCCRPDYLRRIQKRENYSWVGEINTRYSPASASIEWVNKCLKPLSNHQKEQLAIVSGNGWTERELNESEFHGFRSMRVMTEPVLRKDWRRTKQSQT